MLPGYVWALRSRCVLSAPLHRDRDAEGML